MKANDENRTEAQMQTIARQRRVIGIAKWIALLFAPLQLITGGVLLTRLGGPNGPPEWFIAIVFAEALLLLAGGAILHYIKALFDAVAVVLEELRTTI